MEERLYTAALTGDVASLNEIIGEHASVVDKMAVGYFNISPLHMAASCGHSDFVKQLIDRRPDMCMAKDREGRNPLHVAAMNGKVDVLMDLVEKRSHAARARVNQDETILHLCVKHNQLEALRRLVTETRDDELVSAKDSAGNTILHLAVSGQQLEIERYILEDTNIKVNAINVSGNTAVDIFLAQERTTTESPSTGDFLQRRKAKKAEDILHGDWVTKKRDSLMVVASLIATIAFQVAVNPPGGVWQDESHGHIAGEAVMARYYPDSYPWFLRSATVGFVASLSTILLLISGLPMKNKIWMWILMVIMWLTITATAAAFAVAMVWVTPKKDRKPLSRTIKGAVIGFCSVIALLLLVHTIRLVGIVFNEKRIRNRAIHRIHSRQRARPFRNIVNEWFNTIRTIFRRKCGGRQVTPQSPLRRSRNCTV